MKVVEIEYSELLDRSKSLNERIEQAYGHEGLGICVINNIPRYITARGHLLHLGYQLANLGDERLGKLEISEQNNAVGWSKGAEKFNGRPDMLRGYFQASPVGDDAFVATNVWPSDDIPEFKKAFKDLGKIMIDAGQLLAYHIDEYVHLVQPMYDKGRLQELLCSSNTHLGRLLHYFPPSMEESKSTNTNDQWCGWHNDLGGLTGLSSAMYTNKKGEEIEDFFDQEGGLFVKNRFAEPQRVKIPHNSLAFQIGEAIQILSGGILEATPHCVMIGPKTFGKQITRTTFACFIQPSFDTLLNVPEGFDACDVINRESYKVPPLQERWEPDISFREFVKRCSDAYSNYNEQK